MYPLPQKDGFDFYLGQFAGHIVAFTSLLEYQVARAPVCVCVCVHVCVCMYLSVYLAGWLAGWLAAASVYCSGCLFPFPAACCCAASAHTHTHTHTHTHSLTPLCAILAPCDTLWQTLQENARPILTLYHYTELKRSKGTA